MIRKILLAISALVFPGVLFAHTGVVGGFAGGFLHPLTGLDHVVAMVAVGLWGAFLGGRAIWTLPVVFPFIMSVGGVLGVLGAPLPAVEMGIALSAVALGAVVLFGYRAPLPVAAFIVAFFAIFHGHAHGTELPNAANAIAYSFGFVLATGLLHLSGIVIGFLTKLERGTLIVRALGGVIAAIGFGFLFGVL